MLDGASELVVGAELDCMPESAVVVGATLKSMLGGLAEDDAELTWGSIAGRKPWFDAAVEDGEDGELSSTLADVSLEV